MKRGHVVGTRKVTRKHQAWYDATQEAHLARITQDWAAFAQAEATAIEQIVRDVRDVSTHALQGYMAYVTYSVA